jgi:hypothetical protein
MRLNAAATLACSAVLLTATACTSDSPTAASGEATSYAPGSIEARCRALHWPQRMPDVSNQELDPLSKQLRCFDNLNALAPDGHDVMDDPANEAHRWTVATSRPGADTQVYRTTPITLVLRAPSS